MKNVIKTLFLVGAICASETSIAQVNIGGQTATKIVTHAVVPSVTPAATTQKIVSQATNVTGKVANQTQTAVQATQNQAANINTQVAGQTQTAVQTGQNQASTVSGNGTVTTDATANKNGSNADGSSNTSVSANKSGQSASGSSSVKGSARVNAKQVAATGKAKYNTSARKVKAADYRI